MESTREAHPPTTRLCPGCSAAMREETVLGVALDACTSCGGIWFDFEELRALLTRDPLALGTLEDRTVPSEIQQEPAGPSARRCPECNQPLQQYHYLYTSPVVLDICTVCSGFFVDDGELSQMQQWLERNRQPMSPNENAWRTMNEAATAHDREMRRQRNLRDLFDTLRRNPPGWLGLIL